MEIGGSFGCGGVVGAGTSVVDLHSPQSSSNSSISTTTVDDPGPGLAGAAAVVSFGFG